MIFSSTLLTSMLLAGPMGDECSASRAVQASHQEQDIVQTALANGSFGTLAKALHAAEQVDALKGEGPFTVFAPTDAAFAKLPEEQLASLLEPENKDLLAAILTYHVVAAELEAEDITKQKFAQTLNGQRLDFAASEEGVTVDGAAVTTTDIRCTNGVIHVIDSVILPSTMDVVQTAVEAGSFETLATALRAAALVEALQGEGPYTVFAPTDDAFAKLPEGTVETLSSPRTATG